MLALAGVGQHLLHVAHAAAVEAFRQLVAHGGALTLHPGVIFRQVHQAVGQRVAQIGQLIKQAVPVFNDAANLMAGIGHLAPRTSS